MRIIYTSDTHSYLFPTPYFERGERNMGLMRICESFESDEDTVVIDGGDTIQGSALSKYVFDRKKCPFPQAEIFRRMGLSLAVPGNHDFNYGYDVFKTFFSQTGATVLAANVRDLTGGINIVPHVIMTDSDGLRVAFAGVVTSFVNVWEKSENIRNFEITSAFEAAKREYEILKGQADILVLIYHGGFENDIATGRVLSETGENEGYRMCMELGYDLLLSAHQHMVIQPTLVSGTLILQVGANAMNYADIRLSSSGINAAIREPDEYGAHNLEKEYSALNDDINRWLDRSVATIPEEIKAPGLLESALNGSRIADFFNYVQLSVSGADISCTSLANKLYGFSRDITIREVIASYQYPNTLEVLEVGEAELRFALERAAEYFDYSDGRVSISKSFLEPKIENYNYDYYLGLSYTFDLRKPAGQRVTRLLYEGAELGGKRLRLCLNNYRASGTGGYDVFRECRKISSLNLDVQDLAVSFLLSHGGDITWPKADFTCIC